jgi:DNA-binding NarL/FixJ family response regulator
VIDVTQAEPPALIAVSVVEDNRGVRESLAALLNQTPGFRCLSAFATGEEAVLRMPGEPPDVALVDIRLPGMDGIDCVARLTGVLRRLKVLVLTRYERSDLIFQALRSGASGYLLKSAAPAELLDSIREVHAGGAPMSMQVARKVVRYFREMEAGSSGLESLSAREQEILRRLSQGYTYREIAESAGITVSTVRAHAHSIYAKLHVRSRGRAAFKWRQQAGVARRLSPAE